MIAIEPLGPDRDVVLRNLYQLYIHDMSEWLAIDVQPDGSFAFDTQPVWDRCQVHLATLDGALAGFGVDAPVTLDGREARDVKDFFVLRRYRHRAVGDALAEHIWSATPGFWQVRVLVANRPAVAFWERMVRRNSRGFYEARRTRERERDWIHLRWDSHPE